MQNGFLAGYVVNLHHIIGKCRENIIFIHTRHSSIKYNAQFSPITTFIFIDFFPQTVQWARSSLICSRREDKLSYGVVVQCLSQMLCPFSTDIVPPKIESVECLYLSIMVYMQSKRRQVILPCCCAVLEPDVVPLQHRYC